MTEQKLADIAVGGKGTVLGFVSGGDTYRRKLLAMGLMKGVEFEVKRVAPLGDPVEILVRGYNLSLRKAEANSLRVEAK
ncbi:MAG: ferrous iron transport protein A [Desulfobulbaceae bacterium]|jgi:ferrous iron transport protein A|nr:ferrous iron transport protein A [Desulfobulbaceae bacterium]